MRKTILAAALVVLAASPALAQDEATARKGLAAFLADAMGAKDVPTGIERAAGLDRLRPGALGFIEPGALAAAVDSRTGSVVFFSKFAPLLQVPSATKDRAAEVARRAKHSLDDDVKRARDFLAAHTAGSKERVFEIAEQERTDHDALVLDSVTFVERPAKGVVACWPNRVHVSVNPEDGAIVTWIADDQRIESKEAPKVKKEAALKAAREKFGERVAKDASVDLVAVEGEKGPRTAWLIANHFVVDARTGTCRVLGEK